MFGVRIIPPNGSIHPNPMSSTMMYKMFGAPSGAAGGIGNAGSESSNVRPIRPGKRSPSRYVFMPDTTFTHGFADTPGARGRLRSKVPRLRPRLRHELLVCQDRR